MTFPASDYNGQACFLNDLDGIPGVAPEELTPDSVWTTRDKRRVAIKDMDDSHLLNTIRVLRGKSLIGTTFETSNVRRRQWINVMANEAYRRGLSIDDLDEKDPVHE